MCKWKYSSHLQNIHWALIVQDNWSLKPLLKNEESLFWTEVNFYYVFSFLFCNC